MADFIINDDNWESVAIDDHHARGAIPRPKGEHSIYGTGLDEDEFPLIPRSQWSERIKEQEATKTRLSDLRTWPALDQGQWGYCWAYSSTAAVMLLRAKAGMPYRRLSAHAVACKIMNFRDRGGWGALSMDWMTDHGVPDVEHWPEQSMNRQNNNDNTWRNAAEHRITEGWIDLDISHPADADLSFEQVATLLLCNIPVVVDFNWWAHSVCAMDLVETSPGQFGLRILNSWSDNWGEKGTGVLEGRRAIPDGACAPRAVVVT